MGLQFSRAVEDTEIWSAIGDGFSLLLFCRLNFYNPLGESPIWSPRGGQFFPQGGLRNRCWPLGGVALPLISLAEGLQISGRKWLTLSA